MQAALWYDNINYNVVLEFCTSLYSLLVKPNIDCMLLMSLQPKDDAPQPPPLAKHYTRAKKRKIGEP